MKSFFSHLTVIVTFLLLFAACAPAQTEPADGCECELTSGQIADSAEDGSAAVVNVDTCMEPEPCVPDTLDVESYGDGRVPLTAKMEDELKGKGRVYALLDIKPDGKFWDPAIIITVVLNRRAPRDNFSLSIFRWDDSDDRWQKEGTAIAKKRGDPTAEGRITHTSFFAFIDETDEVAEAPEEPKQTVEVRVTIPDVAGLPLDEARGRLRDDGLAVSVERRADDRVEEDIVIRTQPRAGSEVAPGSTVNLIVSTGPEEAERVRVPDVIGFSLGDAEEALQNADLFLSGSREEESDADEGSVIDADPRVGTEVEIGTGVYLVLAVPVPIVTVEVPDLIGWPLEDAINELSANNLALSRGIGEESPEPEGTIIDMQPGPGTEVAVGTAVTLYYAIPEPCFVPDVIGYYVEEAAAVLDDTGCLFPGEWVGVESSQLEGDVIDTDPGPGSQVERDTVVTLYYAVPERCVVPEVIGYFEEEARQIIAEAGCTVRDVFEVEGKYPYDEPGTVLDMTPSAGSEIDSVSGIDLYIAVDRVEVPNVVTVNRTVDISVQSVSGKQEFLEMIQCPSGMVATGGGFGYGMPGDSIMLFFAASGPSFYSASGRLLDQGDGPLPTKPDGWMTALLNGVDPHTVNFVTVCVDEWLVSTAHSDSAMVDFNSGPVSVNCPTGSTAIGGGLDVDWFQDYDLGFDRGPVPGWLSSAPIFGQFGDRLLNQQDGLASNPTGWQSSYVNFSGEPILLRAALMCTDKKVVTVIQSDVFNEWAESRRVLAQCPGGTVAVSGGIDMQPAIVDIEDFPVSWRSFGPTFGVRNNSLRYLAPGTLEAPTGWEADIVYYGYDDLEFSVAVLCVEQ